MKQRYTNLEIAKAAYCSEAVVKKAVERGLSDDLEKLLGWVLMQRIKLGGLEGIDGLIATGAVKRGSEMPLNDPVVEVAVEREEIGYERNPDFDGFSE